jgi:hypothetical protein
VYLSQVSFGFAGDAAMKQGPSHISRNRRHVRAGSCRRSRSLPLTGYGRPSKTTSLRLTDLPEYSRCLDAAFATAFHTFTTSRGSRRSLAPPRTNEAEQCRSSPSTRSFHTLDLANFTGQKSEVLFFCQFSTTKPVIPSAARDLLFCSTQVAPAFLPCGAKGRSASSVS